MVGHVKESCLPCCGQNLNEGIPDKRVFICQIAVITASLQSDISDCRCYLFQVETANEEIPGTLCVYMSDCSDHCNCDHCKLILVMVDVTCCMMVAVITALQLQ